MALTFSVQLFSQENGNDKLWKIDSVQIKKNWRTRDKIIMRELQFEPGETVDKNCIGTSINQIFCLAERERKLVLSRYLTS